MTYPLRGLAALILTVPAVTNAAFADIQPSQRQVRMTPQSVLELVIVKDDPLEFDVQFSTEKAHRGGRAPAGTVDSNVYLVAAIDRRTGATRFKVRQTLRYFGPRRDYDAVHYLANGRIERAPLSVARHGMDNCPNSEMTGECIKTKTLSFPVDEATLRDVAATHQTGGAKPWTFRFKDKGGDDLTNAVMPAEAAGLLKAVNSYRSEYGAGARQTQSAQLLAR